MHHHGYLWAGSKQRFDEEALRRPPPPDPPPADGRLELIRRYKEVKAEFPVVDLPPLETAYWLIKPRELICGTWDEPKEAAAWLGQRLAEYAPRFASESDRDSTRLKTLANAAAARLDWGGDVSHGFPLERPTFLSLALVCCSPNRAMPELGCPLR
ncbi:hypothetical protein FCH28_24170 [Streptomyces piniterrae]|uniref:Uncharacterized protein n=1 Tax=Streptomyces piniterrae TaxID=2571125 RepID=A0A4U0N985_9ACTN|nr:hypothetical protein [Streptomyces piniterrae]TJZ50370.1 hypothetical protein FCH28_24170 [Streptomyces piniterrae]